MADKKVTRKLAAILAADMVGYSRLMEVDETGTLARQKSHRGELLDPAIAEHGGRIVKSTGDGLLVEFASAVDAVQCAVEIQRAMFEREAGAQEDKRIRYRVGINIGDIIVDGEDIFGDGVNVAARLETLAEPGGVCVSGKVFHEVKNKLDLGFVDLGQQTVKNLTEPVPTYKVLLAPDDVGNITSAKAEGSARRRWVASATVAVLVLVAAGLVWWSPWAPRNGAEHTTKAAVPLPEKPSIAVLPFTIMSGDKKQQYLADGIAEDLITDLSRNSELFVIARNSSFRYRGEAVNVKQVGRELGVRHVLQGSVRRSGDQIRVNAQLVDTRTGGQIWAERYDGNIVDVFKLQDEVNKRIVSALKIKLTARPASKSGQARTANPKAYDAFLRGWQHYRLDTPKHYSKALQYFKKALEIDPSYDRARAAAASIYWKSYTQEWTYALALGTYQAKTKALENLKKLSSANLPLVHQLTSAVALREGRFGRAIEAAERAIAVDPNDVDSQVALAEAFIYGGKAEKALKLIEKARRHEPHNEARYAFLTGLAQFNLDQFEAAAVSFRRTLELNPSLWNPKHQIGRTYCYPCVALISAYGHLGRHSEARSIIEKLKLFWPSFSATNEVLHWPFRGKKDISRFTSGLVKAGVPE